MQYNSYYDMKIVHCIECRHLDINKEFAPTYECTF